MLLQSLCKTGKGGERSVDQYIGKMLDNRYEIIERIGMGGMAVVYKAKCHRLNRMVAVKILKSDLAQDADFRRRFNAESQAVAQLSHPNIVSVYDVSRGSDTEYIVMELIDGITLKQYMEKRGQLNWRESLHFITQIMRGLRHAHSRGIVHRDIKPQNIMILRDGSVKVNDFGIACLENSSQTLTQEALGSVHYISPEQAKGDHTDARSDIYSAGIVLYEMLTNRLPFEGESAVSVAIQHLSSIPLPPREINAEIPESLELICMKAMCPDLDKRFKSAGDMIDELEQLRKNPEINLDYTMDDIRPQKLDEPTRMLHTRARSTEPVAEKEPERHGATRKIIIGLSALTAGVFLIFLLFRFIFSTFGAEEIKEYTVPKVVGYTVEQAQQLESVVDIFTITVERTEASDDFPAGEIMHQNPTEGKIKKSDLNISVVVSAGISSETMIDLTDTEIRKAKLILEDTYRDLDLKFDDTATAFSDKYEAGNIISTTPKAGELLSHGDTVKFIVSKGPEFQMVAVPSFKGNQIEDVKTQLETLNLICGEVKEVESDKPAGEVLTQTIAPTEEVKEGSTISFTVSDGSAAPAVKTKTRTYPLPQDRETVHVIIEFNGETVYDKIVNTADRTVSYTYSGTGYGTVNVYFDSALGLTEELQF